MRLLLTMWLLLVFSTASFARPTPPHKKPNENDLKKHYRSLIMRVRTEGEFKVAMPDRGDLVFKYKMQLDEPKYAETIVTPIWGYYEFWDKIFLKEGSYIELGGEQIPLTCIHVAGRDLGLDKNKPEIPQYMIRFFFVANDWTCTGPINPNYPKFSTRKDAWDTYLHYDVKDETIMLPTEPGLRYRWNEYEAVLVR